MVFSIYFYFVQFCAFLKIYWFTGEKIKLKKGFLTCVESVACGRYNNYSSKENTLVKSLRRSVTSLAHENIRFSSLFAAGNVLRRRTSATQRQKSYTDDVKSVRNPVISADWSTEQLHCFSYCLRMTDKRQKSTKVKCKREESLTKQSIFEVFSRRNI